MPGAGMFAANTPPHTKNARNCAGSLPVVPGKGVEPPRPCGHQILNLARLPFRQPGGASLLSTTPQVYRLAG